MIKILRIIFNIFVEYCSNSSITGLKYIVEKGVKKCEIFYWIVWFVLTAVGSAYLILGSLENFSKYSVGMVIVNIQPNDVTEFPAIAICERNHVDGENKKFKDVINQLIEASDEEVDNSYGAEDFLQRIIFHNLYTDNANAYCPFDYDEGDLKCPLDGFLNITNAVRMTCDEMFYNCKWGNIEFRCCDYFIPIATSVGKCFMLNSINARPTDSAMKKLLRISTESSEVLKLATRESFTVHVLNEEDIPLSLLTELTYNQDSLVEVALLQLHIQNVINDAEVRDLDPESRRCRFPDERLESLYPFYSFSVCVTDCLKKYQVDNCNCTHPHLFYGDEDSTPVCNLAGIKCLEDVAGIFPSSKILQQWHSTRFSCPCLPSCTQHELSIIGKTTEDQQNIEDIGNDPIYRIHIRVLSLPTQRYRRQSVRHQLDIVVSIGGIVSLFMGASILSIVELVYFCTVRLIGKCYSSRSNK